MHGDRGGECGEIGPCQKGLSGCFQRPFLTTHDPHDMISCSHLQVFSRHLVIQNLH